MFVYMRFNTDIAHSNSFVTRDSQIQDIEPQILVNMILFLKRAFLCFWKTDGGHQ